MFEQTYHLAGQGPFGTQASVFHFGDSSQPDSLVPSGLREVSGRIGPQSRVSIPLLVKVPLMAVDEYSGEARGRRVVTARVATPR